jgi:hypothetical protein
LRSRIVTTAIVTTAIIIPSWSLLTKSAANLLSMGKRLQVIPCAGSRFPG